MWYGDRDDRFARKCLSSKGTTANGINLDIPATVNPIHDDAGLAVMQFVSDHINLHLGFQLQAAQLAAVAAAPPVESGGQQGASTQAA